MGSNGRKVLCTDIVEGIRKHYCVTLLLVHRVSPSRVQFRAGSSIRGKGGSVHLATELIAHPLYDYYTIDFDVAVVRVSSCFSFVYVSLLDGSSFRTAHYTVIETRISVHRKKQIQFQMNYHYFIKELIKLSGSRCDYSATDWETEESDFDSR